jgi:hypothetical protein
MGVPPNSAIPPLTVAGKSYKSVLRWDLRGDVRFFVFAILAVFTIDWLYFRSSVTATQLRGWIVVVAIYVIWPFIRATFVLHKNKREKLHAAYKFVDAEVVLRELWQAALIQVEALGFRRTAFFEKETSHPLVKVFCCILVHPAHGNMAQVVAVKSSLRNRDLIVFNSVFDDGLVLETSNGHEPPVFRKKAKFMTLRFPRQRILVDQYILHRRLVEELAQSRKLLTATPDQMVDDFLANAEKIHAMNMDPREYKLSESSDCYRYTWRGAIRTAFLRTWPVVAFRRNNLYAEADEVLKRLGFQVDKLGGLQGINRLEEIKRFAGSSPISISPDSPPVGHLEP